MLTQLDVDSIASEIAAGYINIKTHPTAQLYILNYSPKAQYAWRWNDATEQCRGLIVTHDWQIVARPFRKFFSLEQLDGIVPNEPFEVYEKLDGSLGILYYLDGVPAIATRGSFVSTQAIRATEIYQKKYAHIHTNPAHTYLFEIIFRENRIVVNYGDMEDLILIAVIDTATGKDVPLPDIGFTVVKRYTNFHEFSALTKHQDNEREGYVARFESGSRVKIKFEEYKRLHKLLTGVSEKDVWEAMKIGKNLSNMSDRIPEDFRIWLLQTEAHLRDSYHDIHRIAQAAMRNFSSRKDAAAYFNTCSYPAVMFALLDNRDTSALIWKIIKPRGNTYRYIASDS